MISESYAGERIPKPIDLGASPFVIFVLFVLFVVKSIAVLRLKYTL